MGVYVLLANTTITILSINFTNVLLSDHFLDQIEMVIHFFSRYILHLQLYLQALYNTRFYVFSVPEINV